MPVRHFHHSQFEDAAQLLELKTGPISVCIPTLNEGSTIGEIVTLCARGDTDEAVPEPWRSSRLWLGITLFGTGDFKTWKRNGK